MMKRGRAAAIAILGTLCAATGCNAPGVGAPFTLTPGPYTGFAAYGATDSRIESAITGTLAVSDTSTGTLTMASLPLAGDLTLQLTVSKDLSAATLSASPEWFTPASLALQSDGCYSAANGNGSPNVACLLGTEFFFRLESTNGSTIELFLDPAAVAGNTGTLEPPASYTAEALFQKAVAQDFATRIEFERVVAAHLTAENAVKNLLPHLSINDVLNVLSFNVLNIIKTIGDLVPFALPSRWTHAEEAEFQSQAEYYGWVSMRMDAGSTAAGLALSLERDDAILATLNTEIGSLNGVLDEVAEKEQDGLVQLGSTDELSTALATVTEARDAISAGIDDDRTAVAQAAGFVNPEAVTDVTPGPYDQPPTIELTEQQIDDAATSRSVELRQMAALIEAAKLDKDGRYFNFLDPSGDSSGGFGFGWTDYVEIGQAEVDGLVTKQGELQAQVLSSVQSALDLQTAGNTALADANSDVDIQNRLIDRYLANLRTGITVSLTDMASAYEERSKAEVSQISNTFAVRNALLQLDRLMVSTDYEAVLTSSAALMPSAP